MAAPPGRALTQRFGRKRPDFAQRGVIMGQGGNGFDVAPEAQDGDHLVDQFGGARPDDGRAEQLPRLGLADQLGESLGFPLDLSASLVAESMGGDADRDFVFTGFFLGQSEHGHLRFGKQRRELHAVIHRLAATAQKPLLPGGIAGGDSALLHREVLDFERAAHIAGGEDVPAPGALLFVGDDVIVFTEFHSRRLEPKGFDTGVPSQRKHDFIRIYRFGPASDSQLHRFLPARSFGGGFNLGVKNNLHPRLGQRLCQGRRDVAVGGVKDLTVFADHRNPTADGGVVVGRLKAHGPIAQHDYRGGKRLMIEDIVAREIPDLRQPWNFGFGNIRAGRHKK